jgi:ABC-type multidrug transport system fused ATPase/permease subunit
MWLVAEEQDVAEDEDVVAGTTPMQDRIKEREDPTTTREVEEEGENIYIKNTKNKVLFLLFDDLKLDRNVFHFHILKVVCVIVIVSTTRVHFIIAVIIILIIIIIIIIIVIVMMIMTMSMIVFVCTLCCSFCGRRFHPHNQIHALSALDQMGAMAMMSSMQHSNFSTRI